MARQCREDCKHSHCRRHGDEEMQGSTDSGITQPGSGPHLPPSHARSSKDEDDGINCLDHEVSVDRSLTLCCFINVILLIKLGVYRM